MDFFILVKKWKIHLCKVMIFCLDTWYPSWPPWPIPLHQHSQLTNPYMSTRPAFTNKWYVCVTWSRGMRRMSGIMILNYRLTAKRGDEFLCFTLFKSLWFRTSKNYSYLWCPIVEMGWIKMKHFQWTSDLFEKSKLNIADMSHIWLGAMKIATKWGHCLAWVLRRKVTLMKKMLSPCTNDICPDIWY